MRTECLVVDPAPERHLRGSSRWLAAAAAFALAMLTAPQGRAMAVFGNTLGGGVIAGLGASMVAALGGFVPLLVWALLPAPRRALRHHLGMVKRASPAPWGLLVSGGLLGSTVGIVQALAIPQVGLAVFTVAFVSGRAVSSLLADHLGLGPRAAVPLTVLRALAVVLVILAVIISVAGQSASMGVASFVAGTFCLAAGTATTFQATVNGRLIELTSVLFTGIAMYVVTVTLLAAALVAAIAAGAHVGHLPVSPWPYTAGLIGLVLVLSTAALLRYTGVLVLTTTVVSGQVIGSLLLDLAVPEGGRPITTYTLVGAGLTLLGVLVASSRRGAGPRPMRASSLTPPIGR